MRPGQNNKRMRGRPNNNRRGPNPLTRSYESNGPDVKIRGNAHHVAEKYLQLARDAHTSGDPVAAENYLQHAEHYFRLIAAAQAAQLAAQGRPPGEPEPEDIDEEDDGGVLDRFASPPERAPAFNPQQAQPYVPPHVPQPQGGGGGYGFNDRQPFENDRPQQQQHGDRNNFQPRGDRPQQQNRGDNRRPPYGDRNDNGQRDQHRGNGENRQPREFRNNYRDVPPPRETPQRDPQPVVEEVPAGLPSFITAAPRIPGPAESLDAPQPVIEAVVEGPDIAEAGPAETPDGAAANERGPRGRRRRLRSPYGFHAGDAEPAPPVAPVTPGTSSD
jgi:hypothetical protein